MNGRSTVIDLTGRVAVVTGAGGGIGAETARRLRAVGATVIVADLNEEAAIKVAEGIGAGAVATRVDVADSASVRALVDFAVARGGRLDVWINNAGIVEQSATLDMADEVFRHIVDVDLTGTFFGAREAGRHMVTHGGGAIVNISSIAGFRAVRPERHVAYDVAKAAVAHMAKVLAAEWAAHRVRVNAVAPGYTNTAILQGVGASDPETMNSWLSQIPEGRLIEPSEIADVVCFLASDASRSITGQVIHADAGYTAW